MNDSLNTPDYQAQALRKRHRMIGVAVVIVLLAGVGFAWWAAHRPTAPQAFGGPGGPGGGPGPGGPGRGGPATTVGVVSATLGDMPVTIEALGTVMPTATVTVRPQVSGTIMQVMFKEGQLVNVGDVLAQLDPRPYDAALLQAKGNLERDQAQLEVAQLTLKRYNKLQEQDSIAGQDVDTEAATVKQLEGTVVADQGALNTAQVNLDFTKITAPVRGRVGLRVVDVGNYLAAGDTNGVVVITELDPIDVEFTVPQDEVTSISKRIVHNEASMPVTALDRTRTTTLAQGTFLTLDNQVNTSTGTIKAKARFANKDGALFPNQFVNVRLLVDTEKNVVLVPVGAVRTGADGAYVYVLNRASSTVKMRHITLGHSSTDKVAVLDGLKANEEVISEGGDRLTDGARVQLPRA